MDAVFVKQIINKKPREVVTAAEWNEIFTLLVDQGDKLSANMVTLHEELEKILNGEVTHITVNSNVTHFGGKTPEEYASKEDLTTFQNSFTQTIDNKLKDKQDKFNLTTDRVVVSNSTGTPSASDVTLTELMKLKGIRDDVQAQLDNIIVSRTQPSNPKLGQVWISW